LKKAHRNLHSYGLMSLASVGHVLSQTFGTKRQNSVKKALHPISAFSLYPNILIGSRARKIDHKIRATDFPIAVVLGFSKHCLLAERFLQFGEQEK